MTNIVIAGIGGQGALTAGLILSELAMKDGQNVTWIPSYGSEMRGGAANCSVKISDSKIASPYVEHPDILIAMSQLSIDTFAPKMLPGGVVIINEGMINEVKLVDGVDLIAIDANKICSEEANQRAVNLLLLGALAATGRVMDVKKSPKVLMTI